MKDGPRKPISTVPEEQIARKIERIEARKIERIEEQRRIEEQWQRIEELKAEEERLKAEKAELLARVALFYAKRGDWATLADFIKNGGEISDPIRDFLVAVLQGKKRPNNRAPSHKTNIKEWDVLFFIMEEERRGEKRTRAVEKAEAKFGCTNRAIYGYLAKAGLTRKKKT
jgi:hypothetical protein